MWGQLMPVNAERAEKVKVLSLAMKVDGHARNQVEAFLRRCSVALWRARIGTTILGTAIHQSRRTRAGDDDMQRVSFH